MLFTGKICQIVRIGPVLDPKGTWGVAIVEVASEPEAHVLGRNDPAIKAEDEEQKYDDILQKVATLVNVQLAADGSEILPL
jgi:hypothetical protein